MARALGVLVATLMVWGSAAQAEEHGRWQQLENNPSCSVWNPNPHPRSAVTWSDACVNGKAQGRGAQDWRYLEDEEWKAEKYTGVMKDGKWHGRGVQEFANGSRYEGEFRDGKEHGRGVLVFANGDSCEGDWREGRLLGMGKGTTSGQLKKCYDDGGTITFTD
jgi:hypothetical protein